MNGEFRITPNQHRLLRDGLRGMYLSLEPELPGMMRRGWLVKMECSARYHPVYQITPLGMKVARQLGIKP